MAAHNTFSGKYRTKFCSFRPLLLYLNDWVCPNYIGIIIGWLIGWPPLFLHLLFWPQQPQTMFTAVSRACELILLNQILDPDYFLVWIPKICKLINFLKWSFPSLAKWWHYLFPLLFYLYWHYRNFLDLYLIHLPGRYQFTLQIQLMFAIFACEVRSRLGIRVQVLRFYMNQAITIFATCKILHPSSYFRLNMALTEINFQLFIFLHEKLKVQLLVLGNDALA